MRSFHLLLAALLVHKGHVLVTHDLLLPVFDDLLVVLHLGSPHVILGHHVPILKHHRLPLVVLRLSLLVYERLGCLAEHSLLVTMVLKLVVVLHVPRGHCSDNIISLVESIFPLIISLSLLLAHGSRQFGPVLASVLSLGNRLLVLLPIVGLGLALDDGTPLVKVAPRVRRIVPLIVVCQGL